MLPQEEKKILEQIVNLIQKAGPDSYIRMTFAGVPEICKRNIENDFGDIPVKDLEIERERNAEMGQKLLRLEHENQAMEQHLEEKDAEIAKLKHMLDASDIRIMQITDERDAMADCVDGSNEIIDKAEAEIRKLKAEIVRMRLERMTEDDMANLYETTKGAENNG